MKNKKNTKKVMKKFTDFKAEEQWLESMFREGWALSRYGSEEWDDRTYVFEAVRAKEVRPRKYRIDYRPLKGKVAFEEYRSLFEDAGWQDLAGNARYGKHIFWTDREDAASDIFSEDDSYKQREKHKMNACLMEVAVCGSLFAVCIGLYIWLEYTAILAGGFLTFLGSLKFLIDYSKHRRIYRTFA